MRQKVLGVPNPRRNAMNRRMLLFVVTLVGVWMFSAAQASAAEILLKNGNSGKGKVVELNEADVKMDLGGVEVVYDLKNIQSLNGIVDVSRAKLSEMAKLAHEYTVSAKYAAALPLLDPLEELAAPADLNIATDYALVLDGTDQYEKAIVYFQKALEKESGDWHVWSKFAHALRHHNKDMKATLDAYEKAHSLQPPEIKKLLENHNSYDIGITYGEFGDWQRAIPYLEKAVFSSQSAAGTPGYFYTFLATGYIAVGEPQKAVDVCQQALEMYPVAGNGLICHILGQAFQALGQTERAALCERKAKELGYSE